jgi:hypothetical protein
MSKKSNSYSLFSGTKEESKTDEVLNTICPKLSYQQRLYGFCICAGIGILKLNIIYKDGSFHSHHSYHFLKVKQQLLQLCSHLETWFVYQGSNKLYYNYF